MRNIQKTTFSFVRLHTKNILWAKSTALPTTIPRLAFSPLAVKTFHCWLNLKGCYRDWSHFVSHINKWTVSMDSSSNVSVETLMSRTAKCSIKCKVQSILRIKRGVARMPSVVKKTLLRKNTKIVYWVSSKKQYQRKLVDQSSQEELSKLNRQKLSWN